MSVRVVGVVCWKRPAVSKILIGGNSGDVGSAHIGVTGAIFDSCAYGWALVSVAANVD